MCLHVVNNAMCCCHLLDIWQHCTAVWRSTFKASFPKIINTLPQFLLPNLWYTFFFTFNIFYIFVLSCLSLFYAMAGYTCSSEIIHMNAVCIPFLYQLYINVMTKLFPFSLLFQTQSVYSRADVSTTWIVSKDSSIISTNKYAFWKRSHKHKPPLGFHLLEAKP